MDQVQNNNSQAVWKDLILNSNNRLQVGNGTDVDTVTETIKVTEKFSSVRLGFCVFKLMPESCHSRMFLAGIYNKRAIWIPDKEIRV